MKMLFLSISKKDELVAGEFEPGDILGMPVKEENK